jgi:hypothetical protein
MENTTQDQAPEPVAGLVSIGSLARRIGVSPDTLRIWERRYGQPEAVRLPSGHRRYTPQAVHRMRCIAELLADGGRPGELMGLSTAELEARTTTGRRAEIRMRLGPWLTLCEQHRADELADAMIRVGVDMEAAAFLGQRVLPLLREIDRRRTRGSLGERHSQVATTAIRECLHVLRHRSIAPPGGLRLVVAPLAHQGAPLTALMLSYLAGAAGATSCLLDDALPFDEIGSSASEFDADAVVVATEFPQGGPLLNELRAAVPVGTELLVVGVDLRIRNRLSGGVRTLGDLRQYGDWLTNNTKETRREVAIA